MRVPDPQEPMQRREITSVRLRFGQWAEGSGTNYRPVRADDMWAPSVDIHEDEANYYFVVELAGIAADVVELEIDTRRGVLTLRGDRPSPAVQDPKGPTRMLAMEINHGRFCKAIQLPPDSVDVDACVAKYGDDGMLWITLPKKGNS